MSTAELMLSPTARQAEPATLFAMTDGLRMRDVSLVYETSQGPLTALQDFSLEVHAGEFVAVLGPSGCGKSTLLKLVSGLLNVSRGTLSLNGRAVDSPRPDVGIVFQQATLLPWKSVLDNVLVPIRAKRSTTQEDKQRAMKLLELVGLEKFAGHFPHELSGGMQQRVAVARGLVHDPALLLMDEPFAALDAMTRERMMIELQAIWAATKKSVLFITHSIQEAVFLADRIVVLSGRPGRVVEEVIVPLARPRTPDTLGDPVFVNLANRLRERFHVGAAS